MGLVLIEAVSAPGNPAKPNDDAWCAAGALAAVFDGATGLGDNLIPGDSDAAWLARLAADRIAAHARLGAAGALAAAAREAEAAYAQARSRPPVENWEAPFASLMLVEAERGRLDALWFGDCAALVLRPGEVCQVVGEAFGRRAAEAEQARAMAGAHGRKAAGAGVDPAFLPALRAGRARYNRGDGGPWVFGPHARCAEHARRGGAVAPAGTRVLLASDGFLALGTDYQRYDAHALIMAARERGLAALLAELRAIEAEDPDGVRYPRFKTSDDATAMLVEVV
jgi:hypothetical protein